MSENSLETYLNQLRKGSPEKCQDCECLEANFKFSKGKDEGWYYICSLNGSCYKEDVALKSGNETEVRK